MELVTTVDTLIYFYDKEILPFNVWNISRTIKANSLSFVKCHESLFVSEPDLQSQTERITNIEGQIIRTEY